MGLFSEPVSYFLPVHLPRYVQVSLSIPATVPTKLYCLKALSPRIV